MSGGHFDYQQYRLRDIASEISKLLNRNDLDLRSETRTRFEEAIRALHVAEAYVQHIDWFVSGDDGEDTFHERLKKDLGAQLECGVDDFSQNVWQTTYGMA